MTARRDRLQDEIEQLFAELWQVPRFTGHRRGFRPNVDCFHTVDPPTLTVVVELPGVDPESVEVVAADRALVVAGTRPWPRVPGRIYQQMEIEHGPFRRAVRFAEDVDQSRARAQFALGVLTIELPIVEQPPPPGHVVIVVERS